MQLSDVDLVNPDNYVAAVPHEMFTLLRKEAPVHWHDDEFGGFWAVTKHDDVVHVNRDARTFSSFARSALYNVETEEAIDGVRLMMLNLDPPDHTKLRMIVNRGFTPRRIKDLQEQLVKRSTEIVDSIAEKGECDFVTEVAAELPLQAIADLIGRPSGGPAQGLRLEQPAHRLRRPRVRQHRRKTPRWRRWSSTPTRRSWPTIAGRTLATTSSRASSTAEVDGEALDDMEFNMFFMLLAVAGNETTRNAISHSMLALIEHPEQRQLILDDPSLDRLGHRGVPALGDAGHALQAHRHDATSSCAARRSKKATAS